MTRSGGLESRLRSLENQLIVARRNARLRGTVVLLLALTLLTVAQVKVENENFEIHPNVSGGNPNDSHMLKLIGDGSTGADRAMTLHTIPTTDTDYRLAISDNGGTERVSIDDDGNVGIGDTTPNYVLDVNGDARVGWYGDSTRIKILPSDFLPSDDSLFDETGQVYEDDTTGKGIRILEALSELYAFIAIPNGHKATHVRIYGSSTDTVTVYESDGDDGVLGSSLGSAATGTEINITDVSSNTTNFLVIHVDTDAVSDVLYGGYVTIARQ